MAMSALNIFTCELVTEPSHSTLLIFSPQKPYSPYTFNLSPILTYPILYLNFLLVNRHILFNSHL